MDSKILIAIGVVAVVVIAAAAIFAFSDKNKGNDEEPEFLLLDPNVVPTLEVYGNVNGDCTIDQKDVTALQNALKDGTASSIKYADANFDDKVDDSDVEYIQKIISATPDDKVEVKLLNRYNKGDYYTTASIPADSIGASTSSNIVMMFKYAGVNEEIKAASYGGTIDASLYPEYQWVFVDSKKEFDPTGTDLEYRVGKSAMYVAKEPFLNHVVKDGVSMFITADNSSYLTFDTKNNYGMTEKEIMDLGIDVIRVGSAYTDGSEYLSNLATICFVMGKDLKTIDSMAAWMNATIKDLNNKIVNNVGVNVDQIRSAVSSANSYSVSSDGKVTTYNYISSKESDYTQAVLAAGGKFPLDSYNFPNTSSEKFEDLGAWLEPYDVEKIVCIKTGSGFSWYGGDVLTKGLKTVTYCAMAFSKTEAFYDRNVYVISGDMPIILRTIYAAVALYPTIFTEEWADAINADYSQKFLGISAEDIANGKFIVNMDEMGIN